MLRKPVLDQCDAGWTQDEQKVAEMAFKTAYERETLALLQEVRNRADSVTALEDAWSLHDFLSARRFEIDGKYDFDYPNLLFVFARLVKDGWLSIQELESLEPSKIAKISALSRM
jgi:Photoprotection regulator fluorescence recovery protein